MDAARPYRAAFASRFQSMLQYRTAALAGFATQCWWGALKVLILAAFYSAATDPPITLTQAITYTWLAQGCFAMLPWIGDPEIGLAVRTGAVGYDRLRPVDTYAFWYVRAAGWMLARLAPRVALMFSFAAVLMPLLGLQAWSWQLPASFGAGALFALSLSLGLLLSCAVVMLINIVATASLNDRGIVTLVTPLVVIFSGNLLPLALFPDWMQTALLLQPFAGVLDIPSRIYFGNLAGDAALAGLGIQLCWVVTSIGCGRVALSLTMRRLEMQGS
jgi:ABC-2 type transport system permease protein